MRDIIPPATTIETGVTGVLAVCDCDEQRPADNLWARVPDDGSDRDTVVVRRDGRVTNRYADGVVGVTDEDEEAAEQDDEPFCPECDEYIRGWLHTTDE